jgi:FixJ family two-component response regulator
MISSVNGRRQACSHLAIRNGYLPQAATEREEIRRNLLDKIKQLGRREWQVIRMKLAGKTSLQIAAELNVTRS